jgi:hypothetical protein
MLKACVLPRSVSEVFGYPQRSPWDSARRIPGAERSAGVSPEGLIQSLVVEFVEQL